MPDTARPDVPAWQEKILLFLWSVLVHFLSKMAEARIRQAQKEGMAQERAEAIAAVVEWLEGFLVGPWGQAIVRSFGVHLAVQVVAKLFPNDPDTPAWSG